LCRIKERQPAFEALEQKFESELARLAAETAKAMETLDSVKTELLSVVEAEITLKKEALAA
jgi:hypothetical protein